MRLQPAPWGGRQVSGGLALGALSFVFTAGLLIALVALFGADYRIDDVGDWFVKAGAVAQYADERLAAAAAEKPLPNPPGILADQTAVRLAMVTTLAYEALLVLIAVAVSRQSPRAFVRTLGLDRYRTSWLWRPALFAVGAYVLIGVYVVIVESLGIDALVPDSTVPSAVTRDNISLGLASAVAGVAAPLTEETFFRGFVFTGLLRWGFWPAAAISAALFTLAHLDPGSMIPFFLIGLCLAWLYWSRRSLWESIAFHALFNSASLVLLYAAR